MAQDMIPSKQDPTACSVCGTPNGQAAHTCPHGMPCDGKNEGARYSAFLLVQRQQIRSQCRSCLASFCERVCGPHLIDDENRS